MEGQTPCSISYITGAHTSCFSKPVGLQAGAHYNSDKSIVLCYASFEQALTIYVILELIFWAELFKVQ